MAVRNASASTSRRLTPTSSTSPSPRHLPVSLPPSTPRMSSVVGRRASVDSTISSYAFVHRRTSVASDRSVSSLRHVGEGVLDDSDSSSSGSVGDEEEEGGETAGVKSSDPETGLRPLKSPHSTSFRMMPTPSPLSRVAGHYAWTEDEVDGEGNDDDDDNGSSPSPRSTDTDSNGSSCASRTRRLSRLSRTSSGRIKSRSRSSTVASLAAPPRPLIHQCSHSSIRTVTAGETSFNGQEGNNGFQPENSSPHQRSVAGHGRQRSQAISEFMLNGPKPALLVEQDERNGLPDDSRLSQRRFESIRIEEARFKETTLGVLREALAVFGEEVGLSRLFFFFFFRLAQISVVG
jgi:WD repeat-containing protein 24